MGKGKRQAVGMHWHCKNMATQAWHMAPGSGHGTTVIIISPKRQRGSRRGETLSLALGANVYSRAALRLSAYRRARACFSGSQAPFSWLLATAC